MPTHLRWVGEADLDRVALCRLRCYAAADKQLDDFKNRIRTDARATPGDFLLAEDDAGNAVGTATHLSLQLWARGGRVPCQGVAWVGAIKTMRRKGGTAPGVATAVMREVVRHARERGNVCSALMPFRGSFYEHFGYGIVERRHEWTIPIPVLPAGDFEGVRFLEPTDLAERAECLRRANRAGQCDIDRSEETWRARDLAAAEGLQVVDAVDGTVRGSMTLLHQHVDGKDVLRVHENVYADAAALRRQLHFLASMRDQYATVQLTLPVDVPLNRLVREAQLPHRPVNHAVAECHPYTRMQVRILDHARFLSALRLPTDVRGSTVVAVQECEGHVSRFNVDISEGQATVTATGASPTFTCTDRTWAAVATGDLSASDAVAWGLAEGGAGVLDVLSRGPVPFCHEYF